VFKLGRLSAGVCLYRTIEIYALSLNNRLCHVKRCIQQNCVNRNCLRRRSGGPFKAGLIELLVWRSGIVREDERRLFESFDGMEKILYTDKASSSAALTAFSCTRL
jgi:hypothetical protein